MRFRCHFVNRETDERKEIVAHLAEAECKSVESLRKHKGSETADVYAEAYALRHAYAEAPNGFLHVGPPELIAVV